MVVQGRVARRHGSLWEKGYQMECTGSIPLYHLSSSNQCFLFLRISWQFWLKGNIPLGQWIATRHGGCATASTSTRIRPSYVFVFHICRKNKKL